MKRVAVSRGRLVDAVECQVARITWGLLKGKNKDLWEEARRLLSDRTCLRRLP